MLTLAVLIGDRRLRDALSDQIGDQLVGQCTLEGRVDLPRQQTRHAAAHNGSVSAVGFS
jgi:hypothetical protein